MNLHVQNILSINLYVLFDRKIIIDVSRSTITLQNIFYTQIYKAIFIQFDMEDKNCYPCEQEIIEKLPACPLQCMSPKCKAYKNRVQLFKFLIFSYLSYYYKSTIYNTRLIQPSNSKQTRILVPLMFLLQSASKDEMI